MIKKENVSSNKDNNYGKTKAILITILTINSNMCKDIYVDGNNDNENLKRK